MVKFISLQSSRHRRWGPKTKLQLPTQFNDPIPHRPVSHKQGCQLPTFAQTPNALSQLTYVRVSSFSSRNQNYLLTLIRGEPFGKPGLDGLSLAVLRYARRDVSWSCAISSQQCLPREEQTRFPLS